MAKRKQQEIKIVFGNKLEPEVFENFMTAKFNYTLKELVPPERQKEAVKRLVKEGYILPN